MKRIACLLSLALISFSISGLEGGTVHDPGLYGRALENGVQANAAFKSGLRNTAAWLSTADPISLLVPDRMGESLYTPHNSSADNYPFMILSSFCADRSFFNGTAFGMLRR